MEDLEPEVTQAPIETSGHSSTINRRHSFWLLALLLLAFALRILLLDAQSIWWDEGISLHLGVSSIADIIQDRLHNIHPPFYFVLLKGWLAAVGVGAFTGRTLSVLASWLQVAVILAIARRWFSLRTGAAAALLATFSAVSIIYGQEIRVYAMLALIYLLLLAITQELTRSAGEAGKRRIGLWLALGVLMWLGLHLHYIVLFVAAYVSAWALLTFIRQRRWVDFRRWLLLLYLVALASLPWFSAVWRNWTAVSSEATAGTFAADPAPYSFLLSQVWVFHFTGLAGALARPGAGQTAGVIAIAVLLLLGIRLAQKGTRREAALLLAHWFIPLSSALIVWTIRSFSHPRYVSMFVPGLILLVAYLTFPPKDRQGRRLLWIPRLLSTFLFLAIFFYSIWGLWLYFVDPEVAKDDVRGVANYLEESAKKSDLILIPDTDWSLPFEYQGEATVSMPGLDDPEQKWSNLSALSSEISRVHLVDYQHGTRDWQNLLPFALGKAGFVQSSREFDGLIVQTYMLEERITEPELSSERIHFGPLTLTGSWIEQDGIAGDGVTLALRWETAALMEENVRISLRLQDTEGWSVAAKDALLVDEGGRPSQQWPANIPVTTYHVLSVPPAVPPFAYELELQAYVANGSEICPLDILDNQGAPQGQSIAIGSAHVVYVRDVQLRSQEQLPLSPWSEPVQVAPDLTLLSADVPTGSVFSGQPIRVLLLWQATADQIPNFQPEVALVQDGEDLALNDEAPVYGKYPISSWSNGEQLYERRILPVPPDAGGSAQVVLRAAGVVYLLGELEIIEREHNFAPPNIEYQMDASFGELAQLTGFSLPRATIAVGDAIPVTLIWHSLIDGPEKEYAVFAHLLDEDGRLIAQHDGPPAEGKRATSGWLAGEYIIDEHTMLFRDTGYQGQAQIEVGFYDPVTGERLLLADGSDHLLLPVQITIE